MKSQTYKRYKPSWIEWLGEIPEHWEITKLKFVCSVKGRIGFRGYTTDDLVNQGEGALTLGATHIDDYGNIDLSAPVYIAWDKYYESPEIMIQPEDVLIVQRGSCGKIGIIPRTFEKSTINPSLVILKNNKIKNRFVFYHLFASHLRERVNALMSSTAIPMLSQIQISNLPVVHPDMEEQEAISLFLDCETKRIDQLIARKERQIELLQEKRSALISHVVTKGLNPKAEMKDSGIEWLGEIPEHWTVMSVKRVARRVQTGCTPPSAEERYYEDGTVPWFGPGSFGAELTLANPAKMINLSAVKEGVARLFAAESIMIVTIGATIGKVGYLESPASSNQQITAITPDSKRIVGRFLAYQLKRLEPVMRAIAPNTTLPIMDQQEVGCLLCAFPPIEEQKVIVKNIDIHLNQIDNLINKITTSIDKLFEYRTALISAAVTGKIDVRKEAA